MNTFKAKLITGLIGYGLIAAGCIAVILHNILMISLDWNWFFATLVFFLLVESLLVNLVISNSSSKDNKRLINIYMLAKIIKILSSLTFILIYFIVAGRAELKTFIIVYIVFYLLFLIAETYLFSKIEKQIKSKNKDE